jgi:hypothetical protein
VAASSIPMAAASKPVGTSDIMEYEDL